VAFDYSSVILGILRQYAAQLSGITSLFALFFGTAASVKGRFSAPPC
jgi:hypothetical protein